MYMTLYEYSFKDLEDNDTLETFLEVAFKAYRTQNKLNQCLKVRDGKYYDEYLIKCVASEMWRRFPNAKVVAHEAEREMLQNAQINSSMEIFMRPITIEADKYVRDKESLKVGNMELTFIFTPGHTKGGMCISVDNVIFSGDTIFRYSIGRTDFYGGDFRTLINSIKDRLFYFPDDTVLLPGHMGPSTIADEKRGNPFV